MSADLREALARWCAWGYGGDEYAEQTAGNEHWLTIADKLMAVPELRAVLDQADADRAAVERVEALAFVLMDAPGQGSIAGAMICGALAGGDSDRFDEYERRALDGAS